MPRPNLKGQLTTQEVAALRELLDPATDLGANLRSALQKVWAEEVSYWLNQMKNEGMNRPTTPVLMVEYAARADAAEKWEFIIREVLKG